MNDSEQPISDQSRLISIDCNWHPAISRLQFTMEQMFSSVRVEKVPVLHLLLISLAGKVNNCLDVLFNL